MNADHMNTTDPVPVLYVTASGPTRQHVATALNDLVEWFEGLIAANRSEAEIAFPRSYEEAADRHIRITAHTQRYPIVRSDDLELLERILRYASRRAPYHTGPVSVTFELRGDLAAV